MRRLMEYAAAMNQTQRLMEFIQSAFRDKAEVRRLCFSARRNAAGDEEFESRKRN